MPIKQTQTEPQETLEFKITKLRETFSFKPSIILGLEGSSIIALTNLEVYNSNFNIREEKNKFKLYKISDLMNGENIYESVRIDVAKKL